MMKKKLILTIIMGVIVLSTANFLVGSVSNDQKNNAPFLY